MSEVTGQPARSPAAAGPGTVGQERRERLLAQAFVRLADTLVEDFDIVDFLHSLSIDSVAILGAEAAGVMLADPRGQLRLLASSEERMRILELFEIQGAQGPCLDAFSSGQMVQATVAEGSTRWPLFAPRASSAGFRIIVAYRCKCAGASSAPSICSEGQKIASMTSSWS